MKALHCGTALALVFFLSSCATAPAPESPSQGDGRIATLSDQLASKNARLADLEALLASLKSEGASTLAALNAATAQVAALKAQNAELSTNLNNLKSGTTKKEADYLSQINDLNARIAALQAQITEIQKQKDSLRVEAEKSQRDLEARIAQFQKLFAKQIAAGDLEVKRYRDVLVISVRDSVLFAPDSVALKPESLPVLKSLADVFKLAPDRIVRVEGNTAIAASSPETLKLYPTSWHLGAARSANVVQHLQEAGGMDPLQLVVASLGEYRPKADNTTEAGKALNRRVEFVLLSRALYELEQLQSAAQP